MIENKKPYITVYKPLAGSWYAGITAWDVTMTSPFPFRTKEEAIEYGKDWAEAEDIEFKL